MLASSAMEPSVATWRELCTETLFAASISSWHLSRTHTVRTRFWRTRRYRKEPNAVLFRTWDPGPRVVTGGANIFAPSKTAVKTAV